MVEHDQDIRRITKILESPASQIIEHSYDYALLTPEEFAKFFSEYQQLRKRIKNAPNNLSEEVLKEKFELVLRAAQLREQLLLSNTRLVLYIAKRYVTPDNPLEDLFQQGIFGLIVALEKFDLKKGTTFSTHATHWIRQAIGRSKSQNDQIRIPVYLKTIISQLKRGTTTIQDYSKKEAESISMAVTALALEDLEAPANIDTHWEELLEEISNQYEDIFLGVDQDSLQAVFEEVLNAREEIILKLYFGLGNIEPHTLVQISNRLDIIYEYVSKLKNHALAKIKKYYQDRGMEKYVQIFDQS